MKIKGHITAIKDVGAELEITMQGSPVVDAIGNLQPIQFRIPDFRRHRESFTIGRNLTVEITPE